MAADGRRQDVSVCRSFLAHAGFIASHGVLRRHQSRRRHHAYRFTKRHAGSRSDRLHQRPANQWPQQSQWFEHERVGLFTNKSFGLKSRILVGHRHALRLSDARRHHEPLCEHHRPAFPDFHRQPFRRIRLDARCTGFGADQAGSPCVWRAPHGRHGSRSPLCGRRHLRAHPIFAKSYTHSCRARHHGHRILYSKRERRRHQRRFERARYHRIQS